MAAATEPSNLNIANVLTVARIAGVPLFGWLLLVDDGQSIGYRVAAWAAFVVLMATDRIDGDLARKYDLVTNFGKLADPIADKALTGHGLRRPVDHLRQLGCSGPSRSWCSCASGASRRCASRSRSTA